MSFVLDPGEAQEWIAADARNAEVLFPYLNGEDLNSRPDSSASRWAIDFNDWPEERAREFLLPFARVAERVRPERQRKKPDGGYVLRRPLPERWWQYGDKRPALRKAIAMMSEVLLIARVSKTVMPLRVPTGQIPSEACVVFIAVTYSDQAVLSSNLHQVWAITYGSTLETRVRYTPSDVFETFPRPAATGRLESAGRLLDQERREIMFRRDVGLTKLYNLVNDPDIQRDSDIDRLRDLHVDVDKATMAAYGWNDVRLDHGFHAYRQVERWTVCPSARTEILDRLLFENLGRAEEAENTGMSPKRSRIAAETHTLFD